MDTPLDNPDTERFTDGSSFVRDGKHKVTYSRYAESWTLSMFIWLYMLMLQYGKKDSFIWQQENLLNISERWRDF